jgi:hypothetical protein
MIQYSKEHDEWLKKKAKDLSLRITNNKKNMTSTQKRLSGFVPNRTPRTATENYQITKSQKDTFRDKVYILFNNDQKLTNIFVGMYEEFYKNDDEMYVYFNITYNDLVKAFKGVVTRPDTVLKTHEKLLNKFQNTDDDDYDDQQTIFNSVNTGTTAHDFLRSYAPQASIYSDVPSSARSLNQPVVDNDPSKTQSGIWTGYSSTKKKGVNWLRHLQSNNIESDDENDDESDDVSLFDDDALTTVSNPNNDQDTPMSEQSVQLIQSFEENIINTTDNNIIRQFATETIANILSLFVDNVDTVPLPESQQQLLISEGPQQSSLPETPTPDVLSEFLTTVDTFFESLQQHNETFKRLSPDDQIEFKRLLNANNINQKNVITRNETQKTDYTESFYVTKRIGPSNIDNQLGIIVDKIYTLDEIINFTFLRIKKKEAKKTIANLKTSTTKKRNALEKIENKIQDQRIAIETLEADILELKKQNKSTNNLQKKIKKIIEVEIPKLQNNHAILKKAIEFNNIELEKLINVNGDEQPDDELVYEID